MAKQLVLLLFLLLPRVLSAHPHMLLLTRLDFDFSGSRCTGIQVDWGFDMFFSQSVIGDYDLDFNGRFDDEETREVYSYAFINLKQYGYFISIRTGDRRVQPASVTRFAVRQEEGQLFYSFYIPLDDRELYPEFSVSVFDPTYFCAVRYKDTPVTIRGGPGGLPEYRIVENREHPVYYDPMGGVDDTGSYDTWRPGLETAYPEEVRVFFP